jgi:hypothetical protein
MQTSHTSLAVEHSLHVPRAQIAIIVIRLIIAT